jgi:stage V sporulation protein S
LEIFKVSARSKPVAVAGAIAGVVRAQHQVEVQAIGAGAINQAIKAIAISRGYVAPGGLDLVCIPSFINISITVRSGPASVWSSKFAEVLIDRRHAFNAIPSAMARAWRGSRVAPDASTPAGSPPELHGQPRQGCQAPSRRPR